ncbi:hypothetical protein COCNU_scaffold000431G000050 [Cocos nucifera]|nr:hypothetical protein [Cocos nucifera]
MVRGKKTYCSSARGGRTSKRVMCNSEGINRYLMQLEGVEVDPSPPPTSPTPPEESCFTYGDSSRAPSVMIPSTHDTHSAPPTDGDSSRAPSMMIPLTHDTQPTPPTGEDSNRTHSVMAPLIHDSATEATNTSAVPAAADAASGRDIST